MFYNFLLLTGNTLIAIELLPNAGDALSVNRKGQVRLSLKFKSNLKDKTLVGVAYLQYQSIIELDRHSNVIFEK